MRCNDLQDQINAFAAGDLKPIRAWRLRRHLAQCPVCTGRLQRARTVDLGLKALGVAAPSGPLRQRVFTELEFLASRVSDEEFAWHEQQKLRHRKRLRALVGALVAVPLTGVAVDGCILLREYLAPQSQTYTYKDSAGRTWRLSGTFIGGLSLNLGSAQNPVYKFIVFTQGDDPNGVLDIDVAGEHFKTQGGGSHLIYSKRNGFLGSIYMNTAARSQHTAQPLKPTESGTVTNALSMRSYAWGAQGSDSATGATWTLYGGSTWLHVQRPDDSKPAAEIFVRQPTGVPESALRTSPVRLWASGRKGPALTWAVHGHTGKATGYGVYPLRDETGRIVLILKVGPWR